MTHYSKRAFKLISWENFRRETHLLVVWRRDRTWISLMIGYWLFAEWLTASLGYKQVVHSRASLLSGLSIALVGLCLSAPIIWRMLKARPTSPLRYCIYAMCDRTFVTRALAIIPILLLLPVFMSSFVSVKIGLPQVQPFYLDPVLAKIDSSLHGGQPWRLLQPILGDATITRAVDALYGLWFVVWFAMLIGMAAWTEQAELRSRFILSFVLCWVLLGTIAAFGLSSVGPCFYGYLYSNDPFAEKMALLRAAGDLPALSLQDGLWRAYSTRDKSFAFGISAMPSLHVAISTLMAIVGCRLGKWSGLAGVSFLGAIVAGSVHLAWHYAIDGYVSIVAVILIWKLSGWVVALNSAPEPMPSVAHSPC